MLHCTELLCSWSVCGKIWTLNPSQPLTARGKVDNGLPFYAFFFIYAWLHHKATQELLWSFRLDHMFFSRRSLLSDLVWSWLCWLKRWKFFCSLYLYWFWKLFLFFPHNWLVLSITSHWNIFNPTIELWAISKDKNNFNSYHQDNKENYSLYKYICTHIVAECLHSIWSWFQKM